MAWVARSWVEIAALNPTIMIGFNRRFDPSFRQVKEQIASGDKIMIMNAHLSLSLPPTDTRRRPNLQGQLSSRQLACVRSWAGRM